MNALSSIPAAALELNAIVSNMISGDDEYNMQLFAKQRWFFHMKYTSNGQSAWLECVAAWQYVKTLQVVRDGYKTV